MNNIYFIYKHKDKDKYLLAKLFMINIYLNNLRLIILR